MESDEDDDDDFMDDDDDEKPDITPVENDSKIREIIDKICDLEDQQETVRFLYGRHYIWIYFYL